MSALWVLQVRLAWRYGVVALFGALAAAWTAVLLVLPPDGARTAAPWLLLLETALLGTTLVGALVILEREQGMLAALRATPARLGELLAAKVGVMTLLVIAASAPIALAGRADRPAIALIGVGLTAILTMLVAVAVAARQQSVITFMVALPLILLPLVVPPVAHAAGLTHPLLYAVPTTGAVDLIWATGSPAWPAAWLVVACLVAAVPAHRRLCGVHETNRSGRARMRATAAVRPAGGPVRALLRTDLTSIRRDPLLLVIVAAPLLLGAGLRLGYPPAQRWLDNVHGFDLHPYRPFLLGAVVVLVIQTFGMAGALLVLDDVDDRALVVLRASPLTIPRYLAYRAALVSVATAMAVAVAVPLTGLPDGHWDRAAAAAVLAGLVAPVFMLATLAIARNKVEGVAALKLLGLPLFAPLAAWWLPAPASWLLAWLPTWWVLQTVWTAWPYVAAGAAVTLAVAALLTRRVRARLLA